MRVGSRYENHTRYGSKGHDQEPRSKGGGRCTCGGLKRVPSACLVKLEWNVLHFDYSPANFISEIHVVVEKLRLVHCSVNCHKGCITDNRLFLVPKLLIKVDIFPPQRAFQRKNCESKSDPLRSETTL